MGNQRMKGIEKFIKPPYFAVIISEILGFNYRGSTLSILSRLLSTRKHLGTNREDLRN